jgi:hypothetical protein
MVKQLDRGKYENVIAIFLFSIHIHLEKEIPFQVSALPLLKEKAALLRKDEKSEQKAAWVFDHSLVRSEAPKNAYFEIRAANLVLIH